MGPAAGFAAGSASHHRSPPLTDQPAGAAPRPSLGAVVSDFVIDQLEYSRDTHMTTTTTSDTASHNELATYLRDVIERYALVSATASISGGAWDQAGLKAAEYIVNVLGWRPPDQAGR